MDVILPAVCVDGEISRRKVLDNWVDFAARSETNGVSTILKFRFHIHQAMINVKNLFAVGQQKMRVFGKETLDSVCLYSGSKNGWNKLRIAETVLKMNRDKEDIEGINVCINRAETVAEKIAKPQW